MITQEAVQLAMDAINKPCTVVDIMKWLFQQGFIDRIPERTPHNDDIRNRVANKVMKLRKWKIIDRLPQGHHVDGMAIFYLTKNGDPHETPCQICTLRDRAYAKHLRPILIKHYAKRIKMSPERQDFLDDEQTGGAMG